STVFLVDDDASYRTAATRMLRASRLNVLSFASAQDFLTRREVEAPGCVLADLHMPEMDGFDLLAALRRTVNALPVVFLTATGDVSSAVQAMRGGAEDYLEKRAPKEAIIAAIHRAFSRDKAERAARVRMQQVQARFEKLSEREHEVLQQVLLGLLNKEIA